MEYALTVSKQYNRYCFPLLSNFLGYRTTDDGSPAFHGENVIVEDGWSGRQQQPDGLGVAFIHEVYDSASSLDRRTPDEVYFRLQALPAAA